MLTIERLKEVFSYDEETGLFTRKINSGGKRIGTIAGSLQNKGYIQIMIDSKNYLAHRLVWFYIHGHWPKNQIDHINRNKQDNRIVNLRDVDGSKNQHNVGTRRHNTSGVNGVINSKSKNRWTAQIILNGRRIYLGSFKTKEEAIKARKNYEEINFEKIS